MTPLEKTNLICQFFRENPEMAGKLFNGEPPARCRMDLWYESIGNIEIVKKIWWICCADIEDSTHFGVCNDELIIKYLETHARLDTVCYGFENVPLWFKQTDFVLAGCPEEYEDRQPYLDKYMAWCHENGIYPDYNKIIIDEYSEDNPMTLSWEYVYLDPHHPEAALQFEYENFGVVKTFGKILFPIEKNLSPCTDPEFHWSGKRDIYEEFFEYKKKYPRFAAYYSSLFEEFGDEFYERYGEEESLYLRREMEFQLPVFFRQEDLHNLSE